MKNENNAKNAYLKTKETGMLWEFFPEFSGIWHEDKEDFVKFTKKYWDWEYEEDN